MTPYPKYKPSGIEWIGDIPEHWEVKRLKYSGESIIGITYSPEDVVNEGDGILVLRSSNIQNGSLAFEDCVYVNKEVKDKYITKEGDILLCARNGSAHLVGKSAYITKETAGDTFGAFMSIVRSELGKYLFHFFNSQIFTAQTGLFSTSTINQLTADTLNNMFISFPKNKDEQAAIANYLDAKTAAIDELIAAKQKLIELYEEEKTALINHAVTKGLNPNAPMKDSGIDWLGAIPEHWDVKKLKYVAKICSGDSIASNEIKSSGRYQVFGGNGFMGYSEIYNIESDRLIIGRVGALCGNIRYTNDKKFITDNALILELNKNVSYIFMQYLLTTANLNRLNTSSAQPLITGTNVLSLSIVIPNEKEQQSIVDYIETESKKIDTQIANTTQLIELLTEYRTALISEVVTGKIKVTN